MQESYVGWDMQSEVNFYLSCNKGRVLKPQACNSCQLWNAHIILSCSGTNGALPLCFAEVRQKASVFTFLLRSCLKSQPVLSPFSLWGSNSLIPASIFFSSLYLILRQILLQAAVLPRAPGRYCAADGQGDQIDSKKPWLGTWRLRGCSKGHDLVPSLSATHLRLEEGQETGKIVLSVVFCFA